MPYDALMDARTRNRVKLWIRAEQALGISSMRRDLLARAGNQSTIPTPESPESPRIAIRELQEPTAKPPAHFSPSAPITSPALSTTDKLNVLNDLDQKLVTVCTRCRLCQTRKNTVFGEGDVDAKIFFIGEGPGENEDLQGRPFVGRAGELLNNMIVAMGLQREQVYIANVVKCRPPGNRTPVPDEVEACTPFLEKQLETIRPHVIVTLGLPAMQYMLQTKSSMGKVRGQWHDWRGIKLMPTYHPAYVLRSYTPEVRATVWGDLRKVMAEIGLAANAKKM